MSRVVLQDMILSADLYSSNYNLTSSIRSSTGVVEWDCMAGTGLQPVSERFCLEIKAIKHYERGCKPRPAHLFSNPIKRPQYLRTIAESKNHVTDFLFAEQ